MAEIQDLILRHFPPETHPYRVLERRIDQSLFPGATVLDIGCGRGAPNLIRLRGRASRLIGIDLVSFIVDDPDLQLIQTSVEQMPMVGSGEVDLAYSRAVMEHLENPAAALREIARVLKPGGRYIALTPSFWDYGSIIAWIVPNAFHGKIVKFSEGRDEVDTFPTHYRANTKTALRRLAEDAGLQIDSAEYLGQYPTYFRWNRPLFRLATQYEKFIARYRFLHPLRGWMLYELTRPAR